MTLSIHDFDSLRYAVMSTSYVNPTIVPSRDGHSAHVEVLFEFNGQRDLSWSEYRLCIADHLNKLKDQFLREQAGTVGGIVQIPTWREGL